jgi:hypothetical protein
MVNNAGLTSPVAATRLVHISSGITEPDPITMSCLGEGAKGERTVAVAVAVAVRSWGGVGAGALLPLGSALLLAALASTTATPLASVAVAAAAAATTPLPSCSLPSSSLTSSSRSTPPTATTPAPAAGCTGCGERRLCPHGTAPVALPVHSPSTGRRQFSNRKQDWALRVSVLWGMVVGMGPQCPLRCPTTWSLGELPGQTARRH